MKLLKKLSIPVLEAGTDSFMKRFAPTQHWSWLGGYFDLAVTMGSGYLNISESERAASSGFLKESEVKGTMAGSSYFENLKESVVFHGQNPQFIKGLF
jgi:hypothetical protein